MTIQSQMTDQQNLPILDQLQAPKREEFKTEEEFEEAQSRWRWTVGRNRALKENPSKELPQIMNNLDSTATPDPMQPAVDAVEAWLKSLREGSDESQTSQESTTPSKSDKSSTEDSSDKE